jgi:hypothetical protein
MATGTSFFRIEEHRMVNHPNRNWRRKWTLDIKNAAAVHSSGMRVKFIRASDAADIPPDAIGGAYIDDDETRWIVVNMLGREKMDLGWSRKFGSLERNISPSAWRGFSERWWSY